MNRQLVHVVDDEEAILRSVGFMLRTAGYEVETWTTGNAFLKAASVGEEGCVLLDIRMPGLSGLEIQQGLRNRGIAMPVIVMTGHGDVGIAVSAMKAGAVDFLEKPFERNVLLASVASAFHAMRTAMVREMTVADAQVRIAVLTPREREILDGLVQGKVSKAIARDFGISARTVEVHRAHIMDRLGASTLTEVLRIAFAAGLGKSSAREAKGSTTPTG